MRGFFFITGSGISYTLSPVMYNWVFERLGLDMHYSVLEAGDEGHVRRIVEWCRQDDYCRGFNVTKPFKTLVFGLVDGLDPSARVIGAVNTVVVDRGVLRGYNTDWYGVLAPLARFDPPARYDEAVVIGAGGAARAAVYALRNRVGRLHIVSRTGSSAVELAEYARRQWGVDAHGYRSSPSVLLGLAGRADLVVNASPASGSGLLPVPRQFYERVSPPCCFFDMVYRPLTTLFLRLARGRGCRVVDGLWMLVYQASMNLRLWLGVDVAVDDLRSLVSKYL